MAGGVFGNARHSGGVARTTIFATTVGVRAGIPVGGWCGMTLLEAFRECGPCIGSPTDTERSAAAVIVYDELQRLARKLVAPTVRDDCIQTVLLRIVRV